MPSELSGTVPPSELGPHGVQQSWGSRGLSHPPAKTSLRDTLRGLLSQFLLLQKKPRPLLSGTVWEGLSVLASLQNVLDGRGDRGSDASAARHSWGRRVPPRLSRLPRGHRAGRRGQTRAGHGGAGRVCAQALDSRAASLSLSGPVGLEQGAAWQLGDSHGVTRTRHPAHPSGVSCANSAARKQNRRFWTFSSKAAKGIWKEALLGAGHWVSTGDESTGCVPRGPDTSAGANQEETGGCGCGVHRGAGRDRTLARGVAQGFLEQVRAGLPRGGHVAFTTQAWREGLQETASSTAQTSRRTREPRWVPETSFTEQVAGRPRGDTPWAGLGTSGSPWESGGIKEPAVRAGRAGHQRRAGELGCWSTTAPSSSSCSCWGPRLCVGSPPPPGPRPCFVHLRLCICSAAESGSGREVGRRPWTRLYPSSLPSIILSPQPKLDPGHQRKKYSPHRVKERGDGSPRVKGRFCNLTQ